MMGVWILSFPLFVSLIYHQLFYSRKNNLPVLYFCYGLTASLVVFVPPSLRFPYLLFFLVWIASHMRFSYENEKEERKFTEERADLIRSCRHLKSAIGGISEELEKCEATIHRLDSLLSLVKKLNQVKTFEEIREVLVKNLIEKWVVTEGYLIEWSDEEHSRVYDLRRRQEISRQEAMPEIWRFLSEEWEEESVYSVREMTENKEKVSDFQNFIDSFLKISCFSKGRKRFEVIFYLRGFQDTEGHYYNIFSEDDKIYLNIIKQFIESALERSEIYQKLEELSITDTLTGLYNYKYFMMKFNQEARLARVGNTYLSLIFFDIDHFKSFNDTYGHKAGDEVLKKVAEVVREQIRGVDIPVRYGGEEFALLLPETDQEGALIVAERLRKRVEEMEVLYEDKVLKVTISMGVVTLPYDGYDVERLIQEADERLYTSKREGRNRVTPSPPEYL